MHPTHPLDEPGWSALLRAEMPRLYRTVSKAVGGDRELAEDTVQETCLRAVRTWAASEVPRDPGGWLRTVALNLLRNHFRHRSASTAALDELGRGAQSVHAADLAAPPTAALDGPEYDDAPGAARIQALMARLPEAQAQLLQERYFEGMGTDDLAARHGTTSRGVEGRLRRARAALARLMNAPRDTSEGNPASHRRRSHE